VELLFKEWKSYANLHAFDTPMRALSRAHLGRDRAATLKRYLAHATSD